MSAGLQRLDVVVRFSTSNPDVILSIDRSSHVSTASLKQRIRAQLQPPTSTSRLRLIHSGKVLSDNAALSKSLSIPLPPPIRRDDGNKSEKAKGKQPVGVVIPPAARVYIHCSVGDVLTPTELAAEAKTADDADTALASEASLSTTTPHVVQQTTTTTTTTTPAPRGFDRLLAAGFTATEVAALRAQFLAIQSHSHTPDTMPTGQDLVALEESWLDNGSNPADGGGAGGEDTEDAGGLEDMLYGNLIGFFWPIGAMCWAMREEGVWSRRRQIAVLSGFVINLTFGFLRVMA